MTLLTSRKTATVRGVIAKDRASIKTDPYEELLWDEGEFSAFVWSVCAP